MANTAAGPPLLAISPCRSCKYGKRKCDRLLPRCSACARVQRTCVYQEDLIPSASMQSASMADMPLAAVIRGQAEGSVASSSQTAPPLLVDHPQGSNVDANIRDNVMRTLGSLDGVHAAVAVFFSSVGQRITIISKKKFLEKLVGFDTSAPADLAALSLAMNVVIQQPQSHIEGMQSLLYAQLKSTIGVLEAANYLSLEVVQCRLLCAFYELGQGILSGAAASIGAASRIAKFACLDRPSSREANQDAILEEERRRVWWALVNMDRFIGLCSGFPVLCTEDAKVDQRLPLDDVVWLQDLVTPLDSSATTLGTSYDVRVGQFARECQVSHLAGRVIRHVFDPASDSSFQAEEATQLERTLLALIPVLSEEELQFGRYCSALGICTIALFVLYDQPRNESAGGSNDQATLSVMEPLSSQIVSFSGRLFGDFEGLDYSTFSPYIPFSQYQAAVVQRRMWEASGEARFQDGLASLKRILTHFSRRWATAVLYLEALEHDHPVLLPQAIQP